MYSIHRLSLAMLFFVFLLFVSFNVTSQDAVANDDEFARQIIGEINAWRISAGVWPLAINETLQIMAYDQAVYLVTHTNIATEGGDFHRDADGQYPRQRSRRAPYNWPSYNIPQQVLIGENAGVGSIKSILGFWRGSTVHSSTIINTDYREIGVAAIPVGSDYLVIAAFGGRPNVLPALIGPQDGRLYLSDDVSSYAEEKSDWFANAASVEFLDTDLNPITSEQTSWSTSIELPDEAGNQFIVRYSDGINTIDTEINRNEDQIVLPGFLYPVEVEHENSSTVVAAPLDNVSVASAELLAAYPDQNRTMAFELLGKINAWRLDEALWPLKPNETLESLALQQASYLINETTIPANGGDFHRGPDGEDVAERAQASPHDWPQYTASEDVVIAESSAVGDVDFAVRLWRQSSDDRQNILSSAYREVGIAALPLEAEGEYLFMIVLGSRPNVIPALFNASNDTIAVSNEFNAADDGQIGEIMEIMLFDETGRPVTDGSMDWQAEIPLPENVGTKLFVLFSDGAIQTMSEVNLAKDIVVLGGSTTTAQVVSADTQQADAEATTAKPTSISTMLPTTQPTEVPPTPTPAVDVEPVTVVEAEAVKSGSQIRLIYDQNSMTLLNISDEPVDVSNVSIIAGEFQISVADWAAAGNTPVTAFPSGSCLQMWSWMLSSVAKPDQCRTRWSIYTLAPERMFWTQGEFFVQRDGTVLAVCLADEPSCEVDV